MLSFFIFYRIRLINVPKLHYFVDYIRTYTFEKRVESFVKKQTGILGGMSKLPTIIAPQHYRQRFYDAMDRYFPTVPDRWEGLSKI